MRVLWFAGNAALYAQRAAYNGGGWIGALQLALRSQRQTDITLGVSIPWDAEFKEEKDGVTYYGVRKIKHILWKYKQKESDVLKRMKAIIDDFRPDIIQVYGTEEVYSLVTTVTDIPVVIHIQGILGPIFNAWLPQNLSWTDYLFRVPRMIPGYIGQKMNVEREKRALRSCHHLMGRTEWDRRISQLLAPDAKYYYCSEMLRPQIYGSPKVWQPEGRNKLILVSIISNAVYKGADVILHTAKLLKDFSGIEFEWRVFGIANMHFAETLTKINAAEVNVIPCGIISADTLVEEVFDASLFIHPSYIENSANTICEAQVLGIPVIATNVGGISSLIEEGRTGILVPANDPYQLATQIMRLHADSQLCAQLGKQGREVALLRHHPETIVSDLIRTYNTIINE